MRTLARTGMIEDLVDAMEKQGHISDKDQEQLANMKLTLASDKALRLYWVQQHEVFEELRRAVSARKPGQQTSPVEEELIGRLHLGSVSDTSVEQKGDVDMVIGGILDDSVGYLYAPKSAPRMSPSHYIWVEKVFDHWYLYRTT